MSSPPPIIEARNVSRRFNGRGGAVTALEHIDLELERKEFVCLLGESGCGKSTLLHILAGLDRPTEGEVFMNGEPVTGPSPKRGVVFQQPGLLPWLTVAKNIGLGPAIRRDGGSSGRVSELIELVGLKDFAQHRPGELSGGMAQRVAIARALANQPDVMFMDEPFSALDAFTRVKLQHELISIWEREQHTTVFVTHDIDEAVFLGTRIVILTPRPGRVARVFNNRLRRPRVRTGTEFFRLRQMISQEFKILTEEQALKAGAAAPSHA